MIVVQRALNSASDVGAAAPSTNPAVEFADDLVAEGYVHTHGHSLAH